MVLNIFHLSTKRPVALTSSPPQTPRDVYLHELTLRRQQGRQLAKRNAWIAALRLLVFLVAAGLAWAAYAIQSWSLVCLLAPGLAYGLLVVWHERVFRGEQRVRHGIDFFLRGIDRLDDKWAGKGVTRNDFVDPDHVYAADLDVFGEGSLFDLICAARTGRGQATLARWLSAPSPLDEVRKRQKAVLELRDRLDLREEVFALGQSIAGGVSPAKLLGWASAPQVFRPSTARWLTLLASALTVQALMGLALWAWTSVGPWVLVAALPLQWLLGRLTAPYLETMLKPLDRRVEELGLLAQLLMRIRQESFASEQLRALKHRVSHSGYDVVQAIGHLARLLSWLNNKNNPFFSIFAFVLMWGLHFGLSIERWRRRYGADIAQWLDAAGELEALLDLAAYAYEHPADPFAELVDADPVNGGPVFAGLGLGHPLLPLENCVRNDVSFGDSPKMLLVSGSNMSGKTTLLRTVGVNTVLALAGAPVRAQSLRISAFAVGATLRINDSIQRGVSRFYAEIQRLKQLQALAQQADPPLLFLLDELLHGTNSADRRIGAESVLGTFLDAGAVGLATTHDLALTQIVDGLGGKARNVHFADQLEGDQLRFDYQMREGVVQRSNALALMRALGLARDT